MIKRTLTIALFFLLLPMAASADQNVAIVKSRSAKPYNDAVKGFMIGCDCNIAEYDLSEMNEEEILRDLRRSRPKAVIALGAKALAAVRDIEYAPVLYALTPPQSGDLRGRPLRGVSLEILPDQYLAELKKLVPRARRVGLVYNPSKSGQYIRKVIAAAESAGVVIVAKEARNPREVVIAIRALRDIDAFWLLPDSTVLSQEILGFLLLFTIENRIPVLAFAEKYVEMGAFMSLSIDAFDLGRQVAEMWKNRSTGAGRKDAKTLSPEKTILSINRKTAQRLGVTIGEDVLGRARMVGGESP